MRENYVEREVLGSVYLNDRLHAIYPTALRTLCLLECRVLSDVTLLPPTCEECREKTQAMWRVDKSVPAEWLE